jgi:hypothetical protein
MSVLFKQASFKTVNVDTDFVEYELDREIRVSGAIVTMQVGENITAGQLLYMDSTSGKAKIADADASGKAPAVAMALETGTDGKYIDVILFGYIYDRSKSFTEGGIVYLSTSPGATTQTAPGGGNNQTLGVAISQTEWVFQPEFELK